jgi:RecJ-like exonuclease
LSRETLQQAIAEESTKPCSCVRCAACDGSGTIWLDMNGRYLGNRRCDDLDEMERCDECDGSGIVEECDRCQTLGQMGDDLEYEERQHE